MLFVVLLLVYISSAIPVVDASFEGDDRDIIFWCGLLTHQPIIHFAHQQVDSPIQLSGSLFHHRSVPCLPSVFS